MRILLTRPEQQAERSAEKLRALGHTVMIAPLTTIRYRREHDLVANDYSAVAVTSGRAVEALALQECFDVLKALPVYCVGEKTALLARETGFRQVVSANGDVAMLGERLVADRSGKPGRVLYAAGAFRSGNLEGALQHHSIAVDLMVLYDAELIGALPGAVIAAIEQGQIDAVLIYSARGADGLAEALKRAGLERMIDTLEFFSISEAAAKAIVDLGAQRVSWPGQPRETALFDLFRGR